MPCSFCQKVFHERGNLQQHQAICAQNPGKKEYRSDLCGVAVFNLLKLLQHKREDHRWTQKVDDEDDDLSRVSVSVIIFISTFVQIYIS